MTNLYVKVVNGEPELRPYTLDQIRTVLYKTNTMILPAVLTDKLLSEFGYEPVEMTVNTNVPDKLLKYTVNEVKRIYEANGTWYIEMEQVINNHLLLQDWEYVKKERNKLLLDTDWVQVSDIVTLDTKEKYYAYRELIRDLVRIAEYPCDVKFPQKPALHYIDAIEQKRLLQSRVKLTSEEIELLKNHETLPGDTNEQWYNFLVEWSKLDFITDKVIVSNLVLAYTNTTLDSILQYDKATDIL